MKQNTKTHRVLSDEQWAVLAPLLPRQNQSKGGRTRVDDRQVLDGILFSLKSGCRWQDIPAEHFASGVTCWRRLRQWEADGTWERIWRTLLATLSRDDKLDYAAAFLDGSFAPAKKGALS